MHGRKPPSFLTTWYKISWLSLLLSEERSLRHGAGGEGYAIAKVLESMSFYFFEPDLLEESLDILSMII
jgi:hypothetical protein